MNIRQGESICIQRYDNTTIKQPSNNNNYLQHYRKFQEISSEQKTYLIMDDCKYDNNHIAGNTHKGAKQWNEDNYLVWTSLSGSTIVGSVFDGHGGYNGQIASTVARSYTLQWFNDIQDEGMNWSQDEWCIRLKGLFEGIHLTIRDSFMKDEQIAKAGTRTRRRGDKNNDGEMHLDEKGVVRRSTGYPVHGGTTGTVTVLLINSNRSKLVITANVGDSDAIVCLSDGKVSHLSEDHGPDRKSEFLRIKNLDNVLYPSKLLFVYDKENVYRKYECPRVFLDDGAKDPLYVRDPWGNGLRPTNVRYEPAVYAVTPAEITTDVTCIAMTRSLADFYAHQFGLTHEPSVSFRSFNPDEDFQIIVATDGVWDCWHFDGFHQFISATLQNVRSLQECVDISLEESIKKAISNFGSQHFDDASLVLIQSNPFPLK